MPGSGAVSREKMRLAILSVCMGLFWSTCVQAQHARSEVADIEVVNIKPGMTEQFEATQKRHWEWHKRQGDKWSWFVWTVESGKNEGAYVIASFGHTWDESERENEITSGRPEPDADSDRFRVSSEESYYRFRPDLSVGSELSMPLGFMSCSHVIVEPQKLNEFENALKKIKAETPPNAKQRPASRWYELVTGGDWPQFLLMEDRAHWADFGEKSALDSMDTASVRSAYTEALQYHADLSLIGSSK